MTIIIRQYEPKDENQVYKINQKTLEISFKSLYNVFHTNDPDLFLVAEDTETLKIIGFVLGTVSNKFEKNQSGLIYAIGIDPNYQNKGIGRGLIEMLEENLTKRNIKSIYLHVKESNEKALQFYSGLGFQKLEILEKFYSWGENAYRMKLSIRINN